MYINKIYMYIYFSWLNHCIYLSRVKWQQLSSLRWPVFYRKAFRERKHVFHEVQNARMWIWTLVLTLKLILEYNPHCLRASYIVEKLWRSPSRARKQPSAPRRVRVEFWLWAARVAILALWLSFSICKIGVVTVLTCEVGCYADGAI